MPEKLDTVTKTVTTRKRYTKPYVLVKRADRGGVFYIRFRGDSVPHSTGYTRKADALAYAEAVIAKTQTRCQLPSLREYAEPFYKWDECPHVTRIRAEGKQIGKGHCLQCRAWLEQYVFADPIARMQVSDIRRADLLDFRARLLRFGNSASFVNHVMSTLKVVIREAVFRQEIETDPTGGIGTIASTSPEVGTFTAQELAGLFRECPGVWSDLHGYCMFLLAATTGMRRGEILAITWGQIDWDNAMIYVDRALKRAEDGKLGDPKWGKKRWTPIPEKTLGALRKLRASSEWVMPDHVVFAYPDGAPLGGTWWQGHFERAMAGAGIDRKARNLRPHSLRHTLNTLLLDAGYDAIKIRATLAWSGEAVQKGYTHESAFDVSEQRRIVDRLLG